MMPHIRRMARGTCPYSLRMLAELFSDTFGKSDFTNLAEEILSSIPTRSR